MSELLFLCITVSIASYCLSLNLLNKIRGKRFRIKYKIDDEGWCKTICPFDKFERVASRDCVRKCEGFIKNIRNKNILICKGKRID